MEPTLKLHAAQRDALTGRQFQLCDHIAMGNRGPATADVARALPSNAHYQQQGGTGMRWEGSRRGAARSPRVARRSDRELCFFSPATRYPKDWGIHVKETNTSFVNKLTPSLSLI
jgi:hypothetical protein